MRGKLLLSAALVAGQGTCSTTGPDAGNGSIFSPPVYPSPWMRPESHGWQEAYRKAADFVSKLSLLEKVNLTTGVGWEAGKCVGQVGSVPRFGFHGLCLADSPVGVAYTDYVSVFSSGQTVAATFDRSLFYARGKALGREHKDKGVDVVLGPVAAPLGRAPASGRNWEGFSPDPWLTGVAMAETIQGIQSNGIMACAKHLIGYEQEHFRQSGEAAGLGYNITDSYSSNIDDKTMHELYLWPFADAIRAGVASVMCGYNQINGSYACQNSKLINGLVKGELGFQGFVLSDSGGHHSGVSSVAAGLDLTVPGDTDFVTGLSFWGPNLTLAVINGTVPEWRLDDMALRIMAAYFSVMETLDRPPVNFDYWTTATFGPRYFIADRDYEQLNWHVNVQRDHRHLIRTIGAKSTVLLKNDHQALPLKKPKFLFVLGHDAAVDPNGPNGCADHGCDAGTLATGWGSGTASFPYLVSPLDALMARASSEGTRIESVTNNSAIDLILPLAGQADATALIFVNADSGEGYISLDGNYGDRRNLTLWNNGDELIKRVSAFCSNTIVVIHSVGPTIVSEWYNSPNITAILWAGLPGQESGNSIVDVLYGDANPAARTPFTWAARRQDYGADVLYHPNNGPYAPQIAFDDGVFIDYRHFDRMNITPTFEFGFGLSYTSFEYSNLVVKRKFSRPYVATTGKTHPPPAFGNPSRNLSDYLFPSDEFPYVEYYIYPYINSKNPEEASGDPFYGQTSEDFLPADAFNTTSRPLHPAGPAPTATPGGNSQLWDVLYTVTACIKNVGGVVGEEVPQLYVSLGGADDPPLVLRGFDRLEILPGRTATFVATLTRRDLSNWDAVSQNWVISPHPKVVKVGSSSRNLKLSAPLE